MKAPEGVALLVAENFTLRFLFTGRAGSVADGSAGGGVAFAREVQKESESWLATSQQCAREWSRSDPVEGEHRSLKMSGGAWAS